MKKAFITGITGQDGYYLSKLLLSRGYEVFGLLRGQNNPKKDILIKEIPDIKLLEGDLTDETALLKIIYNVQPDEIYNLGAISFVKYSFNHPLITANVTGLSSIRLLETIKTLNNKIKYYQASSAEMFGRVLETPQTENTPFNPQSPYAIAKVFAFNTTKYYREAYGIFACNGILFNHESSRRGYEFVTRKISNAVARISLGKQKQIVLGNILAKRDWGFAEDYVETMWLMLQQERADDYVIATGEAHSVKEFLQIAFKIIGISNWKKYVKSNDPQFTRPLDVNLLIGDASKARKILGWKQKTSFPDLVKLMVESDLKMEKAQ